MTVIKKKVNVSSSMGKDFSRSRTCIGYYRNGRVKKREWDRQDIGCTVSQHSVDVEAFLATFLLLYIF